jgi:hypothetical protein
MRWTRQRPARDVSQGGLRLVSDNGAQTIDVAAYGKAVWSWHPLLVSSRRRHPSHVRQVDDEAAVAKAATCPILSSPANRNRNAVFPRRPQCRLDVGCRKTMCYQTRLVLDGAIPKADGARVAIGAGLESRASARLEIFPDRSHPEGPRRWIDLGSAYRFISKSSSNKTHLISDTSAQSVGAAFLGSDHPSSGSTFARVET